MGAQSFVESGEGTDPKKVFNELVSEAQYQHGHGGYTGTIAEKNGFKIVTRTPLTPEAAKKIVEEKIDSNDKWGPALAIPLADEKDQTKVVGWLFFGWASS